jgi:hypothetical protein
MYVDNLISFGRLLDTSIFTTTRKHGDMYEMMNNVLVRFCCMYYFNLSFLLKKLADRIAVSILDTATDQKQNSLIQGLS